METKIRLSAEESNLVGDALVLLTKNSVMSKMQSMLGELAAESLRVFNAESVLHETVTRSAPPKISRGENYRGLPYLVLDYPRIFGTEDVFAIRTMFWWGHYFSVTLHLKGKYKELYFEKLRSAAGELYQKEFYWSLGNEEWKHELELPYYEKVSGDGNDATWQHQSTAPFLKFGVRIPLLPLAEAYDTLQKHHLWLGAVLGINSQDGGKGL